MRIYTSYFYKIRFFKPNQIPVSTALSDPKWFHQNQGKSHKFIDKNGVLNGIRAEWLKPGEKCHDLCHGREGCPYEPSSCAFLRAYKEQLESMPIEESVRRLEELGCYLKSIIGFEGEPEIVLIVHEAPTNKCSERSVLQGYFNCEEL